MGERRTVQYLPLDDILRAPRNPKRHADDLISASVGHFGIVELPAVDARTGRLVAGHGRLDDWHRRRAAGENPPDGVDITDGVWMVPVVTGWASRSDEDAEAYVVTSNQTTILGGWDEPELAQVLADLRDTDEALLALTGFDGTWIDEHLDDSNENPWDYAGETSDPDVAEPPADPITQPGDVWILGRHRLLCGSSTDPDQVQRVLNGQSPDVVYTDPPYGINAVPADGGASRSKLAPAGVVKASIGKTGRVGGGGAFGGKKNEKADGSNIIHTTMYRQVIGDESTQTVADAFALQYGLWGGARHVWWGANHYSADVGLPNASCWLVWDKENTGNFADAELAWTNHPGAVRLFRHMWNGMLRASERGPRVHPTQKPIALADWAIDLMDPDREAVVFDGFAGSGSTLLACEKTGRTAIVMELDPGYCDVIAARWQDATGELPVRESDGATHDFTADADAPAAVG